MRTHIFASMRPGLLAAGAAALVLSTTLVATSIGPVEGYSATDATPYSFLDVSASGGASVLTSSDDAVASLALPFGFSFYGTGYTNLCVSSNGAASFNNTPGSCPAAADFANTDLSSTPTPGDRPSLLPMWSDLVLAGPGAGVYYQTQGASGSRKFIVQWNNAYPLSKDTGVSPNPMTFEVILFEGSNQILFQYRTVDLGSANAASRGAQATIGIRDGGSVDNPPQAGSGKLIAWSHKSPVIGDGTAILFTSGKRTPVVTAGGATVAYDGQRHVGTGQAYGTSAEPLTPVDLSYEGTGGTAYPLTPNAPADAGTYKVTATFAGNDQYQSGSDSAPLTISQASQSIAFTSAPAGPVVNGPAYTVAATGGASSNPVVFASATPGVCTLGGASSVLFGAAGTCTITANQAGTSNYSAAPQVQQSFAVGKGTQVAVFVTGPISITYGTTATAAADGGSGSGAFAFAAQGAGCAISGTTVSVLDAAGSCTLTATRAADDNFLASAPSAPFTVRLDRASQTIAFTTTPPATPLVGGTYSVAASATSGGTVLFSTLTSSTCTVSGSTVSFVAAGPCTVAANQGGTSNYNPAPQATQSMTVGGGSVSYAFTGFFQPIDMSANTIVWNSANGGRTIPVKWRLTQAGAPVASASSFAGIFVSVVSCSPGTSGDDVIEQYTNSSGLQYLGDGNWQYNWATQKGFAGSCRSVFVKFADGSSSPPAYFKFK